MQQARTIEKVVLGRLVDKIAFGEWVTETAEAVIAIADEESTTVCVTVSQDKTPIKNLLSTNLHIEPSEARKSATASAQGARSLSANPHTPLLEALRASLAGEGKIWLDGADLLENDAGGLVLALPRKFQVDGLKAKFWQKLDKALGEGKYTVEHQP